MELTEKHLPVHNKSNIKLNTSICLRFMYITCKNSTANLKLVDNLIVSPDTSTLWRALLINLTAESGSLRNEATIDCVLSVTGLLVSNVATRMLIRTYKFRTASNILPQLRTFVSRNSRHSFAENWGPAEPSLRNSDLGKYSVYFKPEIPYLID